MTPLLALALAVVVVQSSIDPTFERRTFKAPDGSTIRYGVALPGDCDRSSPRPLVLALHPGGTRTLYYGDRYMRTVFLPGLRELGAIMIAPDCPTPAWTEPQAEQAVMSLVGAMLEEFAIDRRRILVTGFSLGG